MSLGFNTMILMILPAFKSCTEEVGGKLFEDTFYSVHNLLITGKETSMEILFQFQK